MSRTDHDVRALHHAGSARIAACAALALAFTIPLATTSPRPLAAAREPTAVDVAVQTIEADDVGRHLEFLASDNLEGRDTPSRGLDRAAEYLADSLERFGLTRPSSETGYFQPWSARVVTAADACRLALHGQGRQQPDRVFDADRDWAPILGSSEMEVRGRVVFAGYGISSSEDRYDDYQGKTIHGRIALVLWGEPRETSKGRRFDGPRSTRYSSFLEKARNAERHGAKGVLVVTGPLHESKAGPGFQLPSMVRTNRRGGGGPPDSIPMAHVSLETAEAILGQPILPLQKRIERTMKGKLLAARSGEVLLRVKFEEGEIPTRNVVGLWPGRDPVLREEVVILGAHYDHIGTNDRGEVHNGADDNGTGTAALLEIAEAVATAKVESRRSLLFIFFAGEEKRLVGSRKYVETPLFPLGSTEAMINLDMIGRNGAHTIDVLGGKENPWLLAVAKRAASRSEVGGLKLRNGDPSFFRRSDHFSFHEQGVATLFFFSGLHEDYHRPSDTADKIDSSKVARIARAVLLASLEVADRDP